MVYNFLFFLGFGTKKQSLENKKIFNYFKNLGNIKIIDTINDIDLQLSLKENFDKLNIDKRKKYVLISHSIGTYFLLYFQYSYPKNVINNIIFDSSLMNENFIKKYENHIMQKYFNETINFTYIFPTIFIRNINDDYEEFDKKIILLEKKIFSKNKLIKYFIIKNKGHFFYLFDKNFLTIKNIIDNNL
jgi:hypothetical protein